MHTCLLVQVAEVNLFPGSTGTEPSRQKTKPSSKASLKQLKDVPRHKISQLLTFWRFDCKHLDMFGHIGTSFANINFLNSFPLWQVSL